MTETPDTPEAGSVTSEADADHTGETAAPDDASLAGISDDQLPEDLQPSEDNPLAKPLDPEAAVGDDPDPEEAVSGDDISGDGVSGEGAQGAGISQG